MRYIDTDKRYIRTDKQFALLTPLPPHRILVVNHYERDAEELANELRKAGHVVEIAHDEQRALAIERAFTPQIVVIDRDSPGIDA